MTVCVLVLTSLLLLIQYYTAFTIGRRGISIATAGVYDRSGPARIMVSDLILILTFRSCLPLQCIMNNQLSICLSLC